MISIIISSYSPENFINIKNNIAETCGVVYELIKVENPNLMGICKAYNKGASKAKYENLLFIHEDIIFHTQNWGELLIKHLDKENVGVVGIAGSNYVPTSPYGWFMVDQKYKFCNYIQNNKEGTRRIIKQMSIPFAKVFAIDGAFIAVKNSVYKDFLFDEKIIGFHGYDLDFSLRIATKYNNYVVSDFFIEHFSEGTPDKTFFNNNMQIRKKINYNFNDTYDEDLELQMFYSFIKKYFQYHTFNIVNIRKTLLFLPFKISFKNKLLILNEYIHYAFKRKINTPMNN